jgi:Domain of unknown function (DUF4265)
MSEHRKVFFSLEQDEDGYPPVTVESAWAVQREDGYELDNIPFYARSVACADLVAVRADETGRLWYEHVIRPSGHSTVRVLLARKEDVGPLRERLRELGCASEISDMPRLISVDIPPTVKYVDVRKFLDEGEHEGRFEYEEGCLAQQDPTPS